MKNLTDNEILTKVKEGDSSAFRLIVERYEGNVATVVRNMLGNTVEVDDVGQEVFIRLYNSLEKFRGDSALGTYITRIAVNLSLNEIKIRKKKRWFSLSKKEDKDWDVKDLTSTSAQYESKEIITKGLQLLKPDYRSVVVLRLIEGYSVKESAAMLGIPSGTVLSRQARGTEQLKNILKTHYHTNMENKDLHQLLEQQKHSFKPYFSDRVMNRLEKHKEAIDDSFNKALDFLFPRIGFASFATLAILLTVTFISNGSLDVNTLVGLNSYEEISYFKISKKMKKKSILKILILFMLGMALGAFIMGWYVNRRLHAIHKHQAGKGFAETIIHFTNVEEQEKNALFDLSSKYGKELETLKDDFDQERVEMLNEFELQAIPLLSDPAKERLIEHLKRMKHKPKHKGRFETIQK